MARLRSKIRDVRGVVGDGYGDGYVAACLAALKFDVEVVVGRLLDNTPPPEVAHLARGLAEVQLSKPATLRSAPTRDRAFDEAQKRRVRALEARDEEESALRGVYDDDYDDRYDGPADPVVGAVGAPPLGDQDAIRRANAVAKADEADDAFWAAQKNLNATRPAREKPKAEEKKDLTPAEIARQRKRANKNKSAVANHHRKDRALRKGAF